LLRLHPGYKSVNGKFFK